MNIYEKLAGAYRKGVPLVSIDCADPSVAERGIVAAFRSFEKPVGIIGWDCVRGHVRKTSQTEDQLGMPDDTAGNPLELLIRLSKISSSENNRLVVILHNMQHYLDNPQVSQSIWNLRDQFKTSSKMLVMLMNNGVIPNELRHEVVSLVDPLPDSARLEQVIESVCESACVSISPEALKNAGSAALGITEFSAENLSALAIDRSGFSLESLWESKKRKINETPALKVVAPGDMKKIGGIFQFKNFIGQVLSGRGEVNVIVYLDEIEKALGGTGDSSGTSQDQLGSLLMFMQDRNATGVILVGPAGCSKSAAAKATGSLRSIPTIQLDLGSAKSKWIGDSEKQIRDALQVIDAVSGGKTLWIATSNNITSLPPELRRRFKLGVWAFDLPDADERREIWAIYQAKFEIDPVLTKDLLDREWSGAEIETCCELSWQLAISPVEASAYIVPIAKHSAEAIERLRAGAENRFLSASYPGVYKRTQNATSGRRMIEA